MNQNDKNAFEAWCRGQRYSPNCQKAEYQRAAWQAATERSVERIRVLEEALRFYAEVENWKWKAKPTDTDHILDCGSYVQRDFGETARAILKYGEKQ